MKIINIGAHMGGFTDRCLELYPDVEKIYCFEPFAPNYRFLVEKYKDDERIEIIESAVSNTDGISIFYQKKHTCQNVAGSAGNTLKQAKINVTGHFIEVSVVKISSFIEKRGLEKIDILKIDAEGSEYDIFEDIFKNAIYEITDKFYYEDHCRKIKGLSKSKAQFRMRVQELGIIDKIYIEVCHNEYRLLRAEEERQRQDDENRKRKKWIL